MAKVLGYGQGAKIIRTEAGGVHFSGGDRLLPPFDALGKAHACRPDPLDASEHVEPVIKARRAEEAHGDAANRKEDLSCRGEFPLFDADRTQEFTSPSFRKRK